VAGICSDGLCRARLHEPPRQQLSRPSPTAPQPRPESLTTWGPATASSPRSRSPSRPRLPMRPYASPFNRGVLVQNATQRRARGWKAFASSALWSITLRSLSERWIRASNSHERACGGSTTDRHWLCRCVLQAPADEKSEPSRKDEHASGNARPWIVVGRAALVPDTCLVAVSDLPSVGGAPIRPVQRNKRRHLAIYILCCARARRNVPRTARQRASSCERTQTLNNLHTHHTLILSTMLFRKRRTSLHEKSV
jgi:hypothetical protein